MKPTMPKDDNFEPIPVLAFDTTAFQTIDGSAASVQSTVFSTTEVKVVRLAAFDAVWIKIGANPTAVIEEGAYIPSGAVEYIAISPSDKIAVIGGILNTVVTK